MRTKPPSGPGSKPGATRSFTPHSPTPRPLTPRSAPRDLAPERPKPARAAYADDAGNPLVRAKSPRDRQGGPRPSRPPEPGAEPVRRLGQPRPGHPPALAPVPAPVFVAERPREAILRAVTPPDGPSLPRPLPRERPTPGGAPRGSVWLHGIHAVQAALANPSRRVKRLLLTEEAEASILEGLPQPWPMTPERVVRAKLDTLLGRDTVHQGAALLADLLAPPSLASVLERPGPVLVLDQVTDPRNVGAVLRSAAAFGVAGVITQDRNAPEETGVLAKAASGALETMPLLRAVNLARTLAALKAAGLWVVGLDAGGAPFRGGPLLERRVVLVLGAEGAGMRRLTRETCDELAGLAMPGVMESLNVSAAATVALYELTRKG